MEDKIEVGEYVRTKEGFIYKIENGEEFYEDSVDVGIGIISDVDGIWIDRECLDYIDKRDIVKHSKQLIDLIEVKDLVCFKNKLQNSLENEEMIIHIFDNDTLEEVKQAIEKGEIELLEILTHEQFEDNCYKVGGRE